MKQSEYVQCLKKCLEWGNGEYTDIIIDDQGVLLELIHIGIAIEEFFESKKRFPCDWYEVGWDVTGEGLE